MNLQTYFRIIPAAVFYLWNTHKTIHLIPVMCLLVEKLDELKRVTEIGFSNVKTLPSA